MDKSGILLPSEVPILGVPVTIAYKAMKDREGDYNHDRKHIQIDRKAHCHLGVFGHEIFHGGIMISGLDEILNKKQHEAICVMAEHLIPQIFEIKKDLLNGGTI